MAQANLSESDRLAAEEAAACARRTLAVDQVVLFGSKARSDGREDSDLDLLVLTRGQPPADARDRLWRELFEIELRRRVPFSTLLVASDEWRNGVYQVMLLRREIERDGVIL